MSLVSLIFVFLLEQFRPLDAGRWVRGPLTKLAGYMEGRFNDGDGAHGMLAWLLMVVPACLVCLGIYYLLHQLNFLLALGFDVAVLYLTMGFRQSSHYFTDIHLALQNEDLERARKLIGEWRGRSAERLTSNEVARLAIEQALVHSHRNVFGVIFWFVLLPGPCGAVLYRLADFFFEHWGKRPAEEFGEFGQFSRSAFGALDWLPLRMTAVCFAIVGDFEDAIYCWRTQATLWFDESSGILLASGAGALGVRLGMPVVESGEITDRPEMGLGDDADADYMQSTVGLVWRSLVLCLLLLLLFLLASLVG